MLAALTIATSASARSIAAGALEGTVKGADHRSPDNVLVELRDRAAGFVRAHATGHDGRFRFVFLPPGTYDVLTEELGFRPVEARGAAPWPGPAMLESR